MMEVVPNSTQDALFINYPGALDTIRFTVRQMDQYVQKFARSAHDDEETLYFCPPRAAQRTDPEQQTDSVTRAVYTCCANSSLSPRRNKRYKYAEYMKAQKQELNTETGAVEYRHYCPCCFNNARKHNMLTRDYQGFLNLPVLVPHIVADVGIEELDEILAPIRLLLDSKDLDPERIYIPVLNNDSLFEGAMDQFITEQRERPCVHVTLTDSTRIIAEDISTDEKSLADKKHEYCFLLSSNCPAAFVVPHLNHAAPFYHNYSLRHAAFKYFDC
jgi:hypothetical protein